MLIEIRKGLNINLIGESIKILRRCEIDIFALSFEDFRWIKPHLLVEEGENVKVGTPLFFDKTDERIVVVAPVSGKILQIIRGEKRKLQQIIIQSDTLFQPVEITQLPESDPTKSDIVEHLLHYGLWNFIRQRPFNLIASPDDTPKSIFISTFDTAPLAPDNCFVLQGQELFFKKGIDILTKLTRGKTYLTLQYGTDNHFFESLQNIEIHYFKGPHPTGNVGTQIHYVDPVQKGDKVWYIDFQHVIIIGKLFLQNKLDFTKKIALCGNSVQNPTYFEMITGSCVDPILQDNLKNESVRVVSGNVLTGKQIPKDGFLHYYDTQITVLPEMQKREFLGWLNPGLHTFSNSYTFLSKLFPKMRFSPDTALHGGHRTLMMTDVYDDIFPFFIYPNELLKACIAKDFDLMEALGIYEVVEEDFALCEVVCPSKTECQSIIGDALEALYKETM